MLANATGLDPARCYRALLSRDRRFDGRFFVAVRTTGIYCRPICPAPTPREKNVRFFSYAAAAETAGFRACLRCRPEAAPGSPAWEGSPAIVRRALRLISQGALNEEDVDAFSDQLGVSARHLRRLFDVHVGASPAAVARAHRLHFARRLLDETDLKISDVAFSAGFRSLRQFNHAVLSVFRASPRALRARRRASTESPSLCLRLSYRPPLDWESLLGFLSARAIPGVESVDDRGYRRSIRLGNVAGTIAVEPEPGAARATLTVALGAYADLRTIVTRVRRLFDLDADPLQIGRQLRRSAILAPLVRERPGLRVPGAWDGFELAVRAVLGQQVTVTGARTLAGRLVEKFGEPLSGSGAGDAGLTHVFPTPQALAEADIASIGLPRPRAAAIRALACAVADGRVRFDAAFDVDAFLASLQAIPGIGPWTAQYVAMRAAGETDAFPVEDLGLRRALARGRRLASPRELVETSEAWRPWRAYGALHLWTAGAA